MFLFLKQPLSGWLGKKIPILGKMFECDLCLGVWAYWILAFMFRANLFDIYIPVISELFVGAILSFITHLVRIGWQEKFGTIVISN